MHSTLSAEATCSPRPWVALVLLVLFSLLFTKVSAESVCAVVKIEIRQELTFERQAFDARMLINNGLDTLALENVAINLAFLDGNGASVKASSNPAASDALFFIRVDSLQGISNITGTGRVAPASSAEVHWLIIPAAGAAGQLAAGKLYLIGATLSYTVGGEQKTTDVAPDSVFVKPVPLLTLDYFLTQDIFADDAFTAAIEPIVPFTLGVRVRNTGFGTARKLKIESAQPRIVENEQGLLIAFSIIGSTVNDQPATASLLTNFGDLAGNASSVGRWIMTTTLSGKFTEFTADFTHADELGGELTSLLQGINTHFLVHDVRVDLPGRDAVRDFLARDGDTLRVYESNSVDTLVTNQSALSSLSYLGPSAGSAWYNLSTPPTAGFMYVQLPDPNGGSRDIQSVVRSDDKPLAAENVWLSKTRKPDQTFNYHINFFDANSTGTYSVLLGSVPVPPEVQALADIVTHEGKPTSFTVVAVDANGDNPSLSAAPLPVGASFVDQGNGSAVFNWTPADGQAGDYTITYTASDGAQQGTRSAAIKVNTARDADGDGMDDAWEMEHFGTLDRDGNGDFDGDGISDLKEFRDGTNPRVPEGPGEPRIESPLFGAEVATRQPELVLLNAPHPSYASVSYQFEVYADAAMTQRVASVIDIAETTTRTRWSVTPALDDNSLFYWRARAFDGTTASSWQNSQFFVNTANDAPRPFTASRPREASQVDSVTPLLEVTNSSDIDGDVLEYVFEVYRDSSQTSLVVASPRIAAGSQGLTAWTVTTALMEDTLYYWQARALDPDGASATTPLASFFVNTQNTAPSTPVLRAPLVGSEVTARTQTLSVTNASDSDGDRVTYYFEIDTVNTFDGASRQASGPVAQGFNFTQWTVTGLADNTRHYWRAAAFDGAATSAWVTGNFFVNTVNDAPSQPTVNNPGNNAWVAVLRPILTVNAATDIDNDRLVYNFQVFKKTGSSSVPVASGSSTTTDWQVPVLLEDNVFYTWRARAQDEHGKVGAWMPVSLFFVDTNGIDDVPVITMRPLEFGATNRIKISWDDQDPDSSALISLYYDTDNSGNDGVLIVSGLKEDNDGASDSYTWATTRVPRGRYFVYAVIRDAVNMAGDYTDSPVELKVPQSTAPVN